MICPEKKQVLYTLAYQNISPNNRPLYDEPRSFISVQSFDLKSFLHGEVKDLLELLNFMQRTEHPLTMKCSLLNSSHSQDKDAV